MKPTNERIDALRSILANKHIDAIIIPSNDPHQSEYVSDHWKIRPYISGFTGSAGTLVVSKKDAALWADSRYFLQVEQQCDGTYVQLHKQSIPHAPEHIPWLCNSLEANATIGVDFRLFSVSQMEHLQENAALKNIEIVDCGDLINQVWKSRPDSPDTPIVDHSILHSGASRSSKLAFVQNDLKTHNADYNFISSLDEICWLLNIRSTDVDFTPLVTAYALIGQVESYLFVHNNRVDEELKNALAKDSIHLLEYNSISEKLSELTKGKTTISSPETLNYACASSLDQNISKPSLVQHLKSIKNATELENAKSGMLKDGIALTRFFIWLEDFIKSNTISEYDLGVKLESFRAQQGLYKYQSFGCIVGYKSNGAIIHYSAPKEGSATIKNEGVLLIDSGAQYENATTDITRTIWLGGTPSEEIKRAYTLVLKGYIELETTKFPAGTTGLQLDSFARLHLWKHGLNYGHGTGHGIGSYSMVHEPSQGFAANTVTSRGTEPHVINQLSTIEPGFYKEGAFGIRTENVVVSKEAMKTEYGTFIGFEPITLCPINTTLIDRKLILDHEIEWLNNYHEKVYNTIAPNLNEEEKTWLRNQCNPIK